MRLMDNVSIITGAGQGIGQATAVKFAKEGAKVAVCDINKASVQATVDLVIEGGGEAVGFRRRRHRQGQHRRDGRGRDGQVGPDRHAGQQRRHRRRTRNSRR